MGWVGIVLQLLVGLPYLVSGLIVPGSYLLGLWLVWLAFTVGALALFRRRPMLVPVVPMAAFGTWMGLLALGVHFLHWTG